MPTLKRPGADIFYETLGDASDHWVTFINGYSRPASDLRSFARFFADRGWATLTLDNRGVGKSVTDQDFTLAQMVEDVTTLWDHLQIPQSHLLGISMGGMISMTIAIQAPNRVRGLVLVSTSPSSAYLTVRDDFSNHSTESIEADLKRYFSAGFLQRNKIFSSGIIKETAKTFADPRGLTGARRQRKALKNFDCTGELAKISCPTLVIHGTDDQIISAEAGALIAKHIRSATMVAFEDAGHLLLAEAPKRLYETAYEFCSHT